MVQNNNEMAIQILKFDPYHIKPDYLIGCRIFEQVFPLVRINILEIIFNFRILIFRTF